MSIKLLDKQPFTMPPHWQFREGTFDADIFRSINDPECDEYRLKGVTFGPADVVIDVGAHIGSFAFAARQRGADRIFCFEPCPENFELLKANVGRFAKCYQVAVCGNSRRTRTRQLLRPSTNIENTGGWDLWTDDNETPANNSVMTNVVLFDEILAQMPSFVFLKLDCEGAEFSILLTSEQLGKVEAIALEYHERGPGTFHNATIPSWAAIPGVPVWTGQVLVDRLESIGFEVELVPDAENLGKIFAKRRT